MNRKNRKEKEQNTDVSKQICVHKTQNTLLEFNSFLRMAEPKEFWHLHEDFASDYSRIRAVRNIRNAAAESKKGQVLKHEVIDRASR